jgi:hypothetical protein
MATEDILGKFRRKNEPLNYYWRVVESALALSLHVGDTLGPLYMSSKK